MSLAQFTYGETTKEAGSVYTDPNLIVETRATWSGTWALAPYLAVKNFMICAAPGIGTARLVYHWGSIKREDKNTFSTYPFVDYRGHFVRIRPSGNGTGTWWTGYIDVDAPTPYGSDNGGGHLELTAYELSHLLDRQIVNDCPALSGKDKVIFIEAVLTANERYERGRAQLGNRSTSGYKLAQGATDAQKVYVFGGTSKWTNHDLSSLLLRRYTPQGVTFALGGQSSVLADIESVTELAGRSVWDILQDLIPRHRGLTFVIRPSDAVCTIEVGTVLDNDVKVGEVTIPKNKSQVSLDLRNSITIGNLSIHRMRQNKYDEFEVRGQRMLACFSVSYADVTMEEGWAFGASSIEADYLEAAKNTSGYGALEEEEQAILNDAARESDRFDDVWVKHRIPKDWTGEVKDGNGGGDKRPALLKCNEAGEVTWARAAEGLASDGKASDDSNPEVAFYPQGKAFEPWLPFELSKDYTTEPPVDLQPSDAEPVYRKPFLIAVYDDSTSPAKNCFVDRPHETARDAAAHIFVYDREMAIGATVSPRHLHAGETNWDYAAATRSGVLAEPSSYDPVLNYESMLATVAMRMDGHLRVVSRSKDAPATNARRKVVYLQDAEYWAVVKGTVVDISPSGTLWRSPGAVLRDDSDRLRQACALIAAWYGRERAALSVTLQQVALPCLPGQLLVSALTTDGKLDVGTPITSVAVNVAARAVTVRTDWQEVDVSRF